MSFLLTTVFDDYFEYGSETLTLHLSFDNVLRVFELFKDDLFHTYEKINVALMMLIKEYEVIEQAGIEEKHALLLFIFREFLDIDLEGQSEEETKKIFDFEQDAGLIFASFYRCYRMDLFEQQGKLHWKQFIQLFNHLDDESKFKEVVNYRKMPLPKYEKGNEEYRKHIQEMKRIYALEKDNTEEHAQKRINDTFSKLSNSLKR